VSSEILTRVVLSAPIDSFITLVSSYSDSSKRDTRLRSEATWLPPSLSLSHKHGTLFLVSDGTPTRTPSPLKSFGVQYEVRLITDMNLLKNNPLWPVFSFHSLGLSSMPLLVSVSSGSVALVWPGSSKSQRKIIGLIWCSWLRIFAARVRVPSPRFAG